MMMKKWAMIILCLTCGGCSVNYNTVEVQEPAPMVRRFIALGDIRNGLKRSDVNSLLGQQVMIGYELVDPENQQYNPITQKNPYKTEEHRRGEKTYTVDFYLLGIETSDGQVSEKELIPMIFYDDILVGQGWEYFNAKVKSKNG